MTLIAGIDLSTRAIDLALINETTGQLAELHRFELPKNGDAFDRARWVRDTMPSRSWWTDQGVIAIGIEDPRGHNPGPLFRAQGAILACLPTSLLVHPLIPSEWRALNGLPGNASKAHVYEHAHRHAILPAGSQDAADAFLVATATLELVETNDGYWTCPWCPYEIADEPSIVRDARREHRQAHSRSKQSKKRRAA